jgi:hypothetical protein
MEQGKNRPRKPVTGLAPAYAMAGIVFLLLFVPSESFGIAPPPRVGTTSVSPCHANITSVVGLSIRNLYHQIVVRGSCLGTHPNLVNVSRFTGFNGTDAKNCGTGPKPPTMAIIEWGSKVPGGSWSAGRFIATAGSCPWGDSIGLAYTNWTPTMIVIAHGFGDALGTSAQNSAAPWQMIPRTPCAVEVYNPANTATPANFTLPLGTC